MRLRYANRRQEGIGIWSFFFEPIEPAQWIAGQSIRLEIPRSTYGVDERRFSIASAPHEKYLQITTKLSDSSFKQSFAKLVPDDTIDGYNVEGDFIWGESESPRLFLAAGIGITPFRAMLADRIGRKKPINATLVYGSDQPLFRAEFDRWHKQNPDFELHYLSERRIGIDKDSSLAPLWLESTIYISGPEAMVTDVKDRLVDMGLRQQQIKLDLFTGHVDY